MCLCSIVSDSWQPSGLYIPRLFCWRNFPGKNTGMGCHFLLQGSVYHEIKAPGHFHKITWFHSYNLILVIGICLLGCLYFSIITPLIKKKSKELMIRASRSGKIEIKCMTSLILVIFLYYYKCSQNLRPWIHIWKSRRLIGEIHVRSWGLLMRSNI